MNATYTYQYDIMPPRFDIVGLQEEKKENGHARASKYAAQSPYHDIILYSLSPRELPSLDEITATVHDQLYSAGTSLEQNDEDKTGDGDQSPITDVNAQEVYKELFLTGEYSGRERESSW
jgi:hypothetical protein